ncbi:precorrin-2 dehydrogenase/sirohydrochlorin ferrochelatase [Arcticibacter pallidicorallinus]|uniref:precorrin-2 dehydrogenase n=1 Tax=Arcticibacter pallidicorallinus TaxID=1259464 RepID=A0A2T0TT51_9SPHI|nr:bifunctional precorrin-2 dehydrogenase/sirohydrochlorin ferrochelatase [Arcticibacter pallidicorallinus]PRY48882.1 precorrin-2 dehydrogenase/sirohydrochlorin ferrochelatase [Arcticibacter pallidicorallinus]
MTDLEETNPLFPIFLKLHNLNLLLVGGGYVAMEKLSALLANSPHANIKLVAPEISSEVLNILKLHNIPYIERVFEPGDLEGMDLAVVAINDSNISAGIASVCKEKKVLTNVADKPDLCDFYLGSIVQKGNLKIAISTNGKSPTIAKRIKEVLNETIPEEMDDLLNNMQRIRNGLKGDFNDKVKRLNEITSVMSVENKKKSAFKRFIYFFSFIIAIMFLILAGYYILLAVS